MTIAETAAVNANKTVAPSPSRAPTAMSPAAIATKTRYLPATSASAYAGAFDACASWTIATMRDNAVSAPTASRNVKAPR
jgi:hypothetical protein